MLACGEREAMVMAPPTTCDSAVSPCFHGCLAFLHRHFPPQSPPSHPLHPSLHSQQQPLPWDCSTIPKLQLPTVAPSRGSASLSGVCMAAARTVWFSFHLRCHRSAVSLSALNVSPLTQTVVPMWGSDPCFSSPTHRGLVQFYCVCVYVCVCVCVHAQSCLTLCDAMEISHQAPLSVEFSRQE